MSALLLLAAAGVVGTTELTILMEERAVTARHPHIEAIGSHRCDDGITYEVCTAEIFPFVDAGLPRGAVPVFVGQSATRSDADDIESIGPPCNHGGFGAEVTA